jgi:hypothetical protein
MTAKHTPGPWTVAGPFDCVENPGPSRAMEIGAETPAGHLSVAWVIGFNPGDDHQAARADADLLAAAPELLEVLGDILACAAYGAVPKHLWDRALAVRAKAEGQARAALAPPSVQPASAPPTAPVPPGAEALAKSDVASDSSPKGASDG